MISQLEHISSSTNQNVSLFNTRASSDSLLIHHQLSSTQQAPASLIPTTTILPALQQPINHPELNINNLTPMMSQTIQSLHTPRQINNDALHAHTNTSNQIQQQIHMHPMPIITNLNPNYTSNASIDIMNNFTYLNSLNSNPNIDSNNQINDLKYIHLPYPINIPPGTYCLQTDINGSCTVTPVSFISLDTTSRFQTLNSNYRI